MDNATRRRGGGSFVKQAGILAMATLVVRFIGFLYRMPLSNIIGDEGNGIYQVAFSIYAFLLTFSAAAMPATVSKMVSERLELKQYKNAKKVFEVALTSSVILGLAGALAMFFGADWLAKAVNNPLAVHSIKILSPTLFIVSIVAVFRGYYQGMRTMVPTAVSQILEQIFNALLSLLFAYLWIGEGAEFGAAGSTAGTGAGALIGLLFAIFVYYLMIPRINRQIKRSNNETIEPTGRILAILAKTAVPIIVGASIASITGLIDTKMVMSRLMHTGLYTEQQANVLFGQLSVKFVTISTLPTSIATAFSIAIVPNIASSMAVKDFKSVNSKIETALRMTMLIAFPSAVGLGVLGVQIVELLFRGQPGGGNLLVIGSVSVVFLSLAQISTGILQGINRVYIPAVNAAVAIIFKVALNYYLIAIPELNIVGAVIGTIVYYLVLSLLDVYIMCKITRCEPNIMSCFIKPLIASVFMGISCFSVYNIVAVIVPGTAIPTIAAIVVSVIIYMFLLLLTKSITRTDLLLMPKGRMIVEMLERRRLL